MTSTLGRPSGAAPDFVRRLLVVEDQAFTRELLATAFRTRGFEVAVASSGAEAVHQFGHFDPDGVVVDIDLGDGPNGIDLVHALLVKAPYLGVVFLTEASDVRVSGTDALPSGTTVAFIGKQRLGDLDRLYEAVDAVLTASSSARFRDDRSPDRLLATLTRAQIAVLSLAAAGHSNAAIALRRGTSQSAVEQILANVYHALGIEAGPDVNPRVLAVTTFLRAGGRIPPE